MRIRRLLFWSTVVGTMLAFFACSSGHPPAEGTSPTNAPAPTPEGGPRALPAPPSSVADASREASDRCQACASATCAGAYATCASRTTCATCFEHFTGGCFGEEAFEAALACTCTQCSDCTDQCQGISCLRCTASACVQQTKACTDDPVCSDCLVTSSAPGCGTNAPLAALAKCTCERCAGSMGCHCP